MDQESFDYGSSLINNVRSVAKGNGYYLKDSKKMSQWEDNKLKVLGEKRQAVTDAKTDDEKSTAYKELNSFIKNLANESAKIARGEGTGGAYEKAINSKKSLNKQLENIDSRTKVGKNNKVQLTGNKEKDQKIQEKVNNYNASKDKGDKAIKTVKVKADTKEADKKLKATTKDGKKKIRADVDTKEAEKKTKKVTKTEKKKVTYNADTKDTDKADKKQKKTISKKVKVRSDYSDAEKKILQWAGVPVDKKGRLIGDISDANQKVLNWIGIKVSKTGKLKGNISDATKKTNQWKNQKVSKTGKLKADTSSADRTVSAWASNPITRIVNFITGKTPSSGGNQAHGTANAHGSFIPRSNAFAQGTVDDLTDWYDNELDDIEEFGAFAHGTIKKLGSRALAMGTTRISDLSEINPIVQAEKNKYLQEKTDKLKSSVGNAHANGGDRGLKQDERALTGELGDELVV